MTERVIQDWGERIGMLRQDPRFEELRDSIKTEYDLDERASEALAVFALHLADEATVTFSGKNGTTTVVKAKEMETVVQR